MKKNTNVRYLSIAGMTAALYVALTAVSAVFGLSSGAIQFRLSEALCILPVFTPAAIPGVTVGCFLSNLIFGGTVWDVVFGTLATLIGAFFARQCKNLPYLSPLPTILANTLIVPFVLILSAVGAWAAFPYFAFTVAVGEVVSCGGIGSLLIYLIRRNKKLSEILSNI